MLTIPIKLSSVEEAPYLLQSKFLAFSMEICPPLDELPPIGSELFILGRSSGFRMGTYLGKKKRLYARGKQMRKAISDK